MKARDLRMIGVALGGLALVVTARGGESARDEAVTIDVSAEAGDGGSRGLFGSLGDVVGPDSIRLLDFAEVDQAGRICSEGVDGTVPDTIRVSEGTSGLLDEERFARVLVDNNVVYGDIDGDGQDEAVVHTVCAYGANGAADTIEVWDFEAGTPTPVASVGEPPLAVTGDLPPAVKSIVVEGEELVVTWTSYSETDPNCCPSLQTVMRYALDGTNLTANGEPVTTPAG